MWVDRKPTETTGADCYCAAALPSHLALLTGWRHAQDFFNGGQAGADFLRA